MIQNWLAALPDDLPCSGAGMSVNTEPTGADERNDFSEQNEQQRAGKAEQRPNYRERCCLACPD